MSLTLKQFRRRKILKKILCILNDKLYLKIMHLKRTGKNLSFKNPITFSEKMQCIKVYGRNPLMTIACDKYRVREYLEDKLPSSMFNKLLWVGERGEDIPFDDLPNSFIIKAAHGSGCNILVNNKNTVDKNSIVRMTTEWLKTNYYIFEREWCYKNTKPKIIIEELLKSNNGKGFMDYKYFVLNGKVRMIMVQKDRDESGKRKENLYDESGKQYKFNLGYEPFKYNLPPEYNTMYKIAEMLAKPFDFVRIDFLFVNKRIYFGEFTFFSDGGYEIFKPKNEYFDYYDTYFGKLLEINRQN